VATEADAREPSALEERQFELEDPYELTRVVRGCILSPAGSEQGTARLPCALVLHGFKGFARWGFFPELCRRVAQAGIVTVAFDRSGSGIGPDGETFTCKEAFERNTPSRELEDVRLVRSFLRSGAVPWVDRERCGLVGHSLGGALALLHAAEQGDCRALVLWASIGTFARHDPLTREQWRAQGWIAIPNARTGEVLRLGAGWLAEVEGRRDALDLLRACSRLTTPALLVHGTADESVPIAEGESLRAAFRSGCAEWLAIEGASHTFGATHPLRTVSVELERALEATRHHLVRHLSGAVP
jgi:dienelactone hydrolase